MKTWLLSLALAAASGSALADAPGQDHHCKLADGSFDGTKTKKQCTAAKGSWAKDVEFKGAVKTGINAPGGETTGVIIETTDKQTYELDLHGDQLLVKAAAGLAGKPAVVLGYLTVKPGVEIKERHIVVVTKLTPAK